MTVRPAAIVAYVCAFVALPMGCNFLVDFSDRNDVEDDASTTPGGEAGTITPDGAVTFQDGSVVQNDGAAGSDAPVTVDTGPTGPCSGKSEGADLGGGQRCCSNVPTTMSTDQNCGTCGVTCRTDLGQHCTYFFDHFACTGCALDGGGGSGSCWSGCCSTQLSGDGVCAPESFPPGCGFGACDSDLCRNKSPNSSCDWKIVGGTRCNY